MNKPSFARDFVDEWTYANEGMWYSSSDGTHATGTRLAVPTSCPEATDWFDEFRSENFHANFRILAPRMFGTNHTAAAHRRAKRLF